ncbi:hypothetical protein RHSIM_Rhsim09G0006100 [Rhododendron simsii]|uniref:Major facilitator superfamily (MFS) profile domain-containing protein n=1 Tax=Rhododendron simsii TaxID=118357 RepID=A0A834GC81_RHOSS|nr:hypothetical protein RHSIM_Rhsim09G0006100 [Rhododendron simsii]
MDFNQTRFLVCCCDFILQPMGSRDMAMDARSCRNSSFGAIHSDAPASRITPLALPQEDVEAEIQALKESVETEIQEKGSSEQISFVKLLKTKTVRRGLIAGVGLQVFQQFVGINTVMYYNPTIVQLAGFASNQTALLLSLVTAGLNALGSIVSIYFIDRTGRKKLLVFSLCGVIISLGVLSAVFHETTTHSPAVIAAETASFGGYMCPDYSSAGSSGGNWDYIPTKVQRGLWGIAATANWISNLIVAQSFLSLTQAIGTSWTFLMFGVISVVALFFVPETKGLPIKEIEKMLEMRGLQLKFWKKRGDSELKKNQNV